jgi:exosortase
MSASDSLSTTADQLAARADAAALQIGDGAHAMIDPKPEPGATHSLSPNAMPVPHVAMLLGALAVVFVAYWRTLVELVKVWNKDPNYSHGFLVPLFAVGLAIVAYQRWKVLPVSEAGTHKSVITGTLEIAAGILLHFVSVFLWKVGLFLDVVALIFILLGIVTVLGGSTAHKVYSFPLFFLIFMAPWPAKVYDPLARTLQEFVSLVTWILLDLVGVPAVRHGYIIELPGENNIMEVAEACSGLRSLTAVLALACAVAYLSGRGVWYRTILVALAMPVAVAVNCLRVFVTGLIMTYGDPRWAQGDLHKYEGMVMILLAAGLLLLIAWLMAKFDSWYNEPTPASGFSPGASSPEPEGV